VLQKQEAAKVKRPPVIIFLFSQGGPDIHNF